MKYKEIPLYISKKVEPEVHAVDPHVRLKPSSGRRVWVLYSLNPVIPNGSGHSER